MKIDFTFRPIDTWPREKTRYPKRSRFDVKYEETITLLNRELDRLGARKAVIQVDLPESKIRNDGLPRAGAHPDTPGVILSFESKHGPLKYMTDVFDHWQDNLRAIALGLEALRKVDRYGITKSGEQYTGWKQLPAGNEAMTDLYVAADFIEIHSECTASDILSDPDLAKKAYRQAAMKLHPDKGGDAEKFNKLQEAYRIITHNDKKAG
jgi:hypothetical protein